MDLFKDNIISNLTLNSNNKSKHKPNVTSLLLELHANIKNIAHILEDPIFIKVKDNISNMTLKEISTNIIKVNPVKQKQEQKQEQEHELFML